MARNEVGRCAICGEPLAGFLTKAYPGLVCTRCDARAVDEEGEPADPVYPEIPPRPGVIPLGQAEGPNPVFIDGIQCWRRYRFGGWITMRDPKDCDSLEEFYRKVFAPHRR